MSSELLKEKKFSTENFTKKIKGLWIDPLIFTFPFNCKCSGECCHYGVYSDLKEHQFILSIQDEIIPLLDETQSANTADWFETPEEDEDFESGYAVGTNIVNNKCSFLDKEGLCTLQKLAMLKGEYKWKYKPVYCILFPLTVYEGSLTIDDDHMERLKTCNTIKEHLTIFDSCREELFHFFGEEGFKELELYRSEYLIALTKKEAV
jgi:Fe-S-cluster containining protein